MKRKNKALLIGILMVAIAGIAIWFATKKSDNNTIVNPITGEEKERKDVTDELKAKAVKLTMEVASTSITDIGEDQIKGVNNVIIKNLLPVAINASQIDYSVLVNSVKIGSGSYTQPLRIPAGSSKRIALPIEIMIKPMAAIIRQADAAGKDSALYTFENIVHTDIPIAGERKLQINTEDKLPVVRLPKLKTGNLDINKIGLKKSGMEMTVQITNPNPFMISMQDGKYSMSIDEKNTLQGSMPELVKLPPKETTPVTLHMNLKTVSALKMGWKYLFDKKDTKYELTFDSKLLSENKMLKNSTMHVREKGTLSDLMQAIKNNKD